MSYKNPWRYNGKIIDTEDIEDYFGMVYLIDNKSTGRKYIGKKYFWKTVSWKVNTKSKTAKNKKKKKTSKRETDWKEYYGSSKELLADIEKGLDKVERHVLRLCFSKTECAYYELEEQIEKRVLFTEDYYNDYIGGRINGRNLRNTF
jgi:hypothetical protein